MAPGAKKHGVNVHDIADRVRFIFIEHQGVEHVHADGFDGQQVLGQQGVGDSVCNQGGDEHGG